MKYPGRSLGRGSTASPTVRNNVKSIQYLTLTCLEKLKLKSNVIPDTFNFFLLLNQYETCCWSCKLVDLSCSWDKDFHLHSLGCLLFTLNPKWLSTVSEWHLVNELNCHSPLSLISMKSLDCTLCCVLGPALLWFVFVFSSDTGPWPAAAADAEGLNPAST